MTISTEPQAVFTLDESTLDLVTSLGVQPIGATTFSPPMEYLTGPLVDATDITVLAGELPVEVIAAASPDLIVEAWGFQSLQLQLEPTLNEIDLPLAVRTLILTVIMVPVMVIALVPLLTRLLGGWLRSDG
ncbi:MAG: hypothetical protein AAGA17_20240 [Actinomycetota bacterium]